MSSPVAASGAHPCRPPALRCLVLAVLVALVTGLSAWPATAVDDPAPGASVQIRLSSVTPGVAKPGTPVTVQGTLRNLGETPIDRPVVRLKLTAQGLDTRTAVAEWAAGSSGVDPGSEVGRQRIGATVPPGGAVDFTVRLGKNAIDSPTHFSTLGLTVDALDRPGRAAHTIGTLPSFLPWDRIPASDHHPMDISWIVPLTLPPDPTLFGADTDRRTAAWTKAIGPGSRLDRLVSATADDPVTWVVDPTAVHPPAVRAAATTPPDGTSSPSPTTDPTSTTSPSGSTGPTAGTSDPTTSTADPSHESGMGTTSGDTTGSSSSPPTTGSSTPSPSDSGPTVATSPRPVQELADRFADRLREGSATHPLWVLPATDPDLMTTLRLDPTGAALRRPLAAAVPKSLGPAARSDIAWPIEGTLSTARVKTLRQLWKPGGGLHAAITTTSPGSLSGYTGSAPQKSAQGLPLLSYDERLSGIFSHLDDPTDGGVAVQRFLAETLATYQEQPAITRSLLVVPPRSFDGDPAVLDALFAGVKEAPWLTPTSTDDQLTQAKKAPRQQDSSLRNTPARGAAGDLAAYPRAKPSPLTRARLDELPALAETIAGVASVLENGDSFTTLWTGAAGQLISSRWRLRPSAWSSLHHEVSAAATQITRGVSVVPSTFNFFADQGALQLTVVNDLDVGVRDVQLTLTPRNPRLRILRQPAPLRIGPHSRATVKVRVNAISAGLVPVDAQLSTTNGTPIGTTANVTVRVQPTSTWIYWVLGIVAGLVLVLGLFRALRRGTPRPPDPSTAEENLDP